MKQIPGTTTSSWASRGKRPIIPVLVLVLAGIILPVFAQDSTSGDSMQAWEAVVLGIVEGATEFLPVSSTGHLILTERALGLGTDEETRLASDSFLIVIQIGAILAVLAVYREHLAKMCLGLIGRSPEGLRLVINLGLAFVPAALVGLFFVDLIKEYLFNLWIVSFGWLAGGVALMVWGDRSKDTDEGRDYCMDDLTPSKALIIGLLQCVAVWPGTSRSLVTILGGRLVGLNLRQSVIFSFLLGMVTLSASTAYDLLKNGETILNAFGLENLLIGLAAAGLSAWLAVKGLVAYLKRHGLKMFGGYRVALAVVTAVLILTGVLQA